jgi:hypothetical protein
MSAWRGVGVEAHRALVQTACTWTNARTEEISASPRTRNNTRVPWSLSEPETPPARLALGGLLE